MPVAERKKRNEMLRNLSEKKRNAFYLSQQGAIQNVLWESENDMQIMYGFTDNYVKVGKPYEEASINTLEQVEIGQTTGDFARIVPIAQLV